MTVTARDLIDSARDFHSSFDPRAVPEKAALRQLSRLQRRLAEKLTAISEEVLAVTLNLPKTDVDAAADLGIVGPGVEIPEHLLILSVFTRRSDVAGDIPVDLVAYTNNQYEALRRFPSAFLIRQKLYPVNTWQAGGFAMKGDSLNVTHGWENLNGIDLLYVPIPPELTLPGSCLSLPDVVSDALVTALAHWMAQRNGVSIPSLRQEAEEAEGSVLASLGSQDSTSSWTVLRK